jgi:tellurite resistance protein TerC
VLPVTQDYVSGQFFTRRERLYATPLLVVLLIIETTDVLFAVDSIPAVLAITLNAFIVYTANVFAILGLRSMYFALAGMIDVLHYLHYGLSAVLIFIGLKMVASHYVDLPTEWTLAIVLSILAVSIVASLLKPQKKPST